MKPQKLSMKSNPLGEVMSLQEAFNQLKNQEHDISFDGLGEWLELNTQKPKTMKNIYKIAASFMIATIILIACTIPVEHEEEIGYMIKGFASIEAASLKATFSKIPELNLPQFSIHDVIYEQKETEEEKTSEYSEVIMVLPEANYQAALDKKAALARIYDFVSLEILPIEETVERTIFESALNRFDIKLKNDISDSLVAKKIDQFIHENSSIEGSSNVYTDENGVRYVELIIEESESNLQVKYGNDVNATIQIKEGIETIHQDLSGNGVVRKVDSSSLKEIEKRDLKERKRKQ